MIMKGEPTIIYGYYSKALAGFFCSTSNRWSSSRYNTNNAWNYNGNGITNNNNFYNGYRVAPVSEFIQKRYGKIRGSIYSLFSRKG